MAVNSSIEWTDNTFNPWWGCTKVSDGCKNCYAETFAKRYGHRVWGARATRRTFGDSHWAQPLKWNAEAENSKVRQRVFCASMADVFEEGAPGAERERLWELIRLTPHLDWQLLTKRPHLIEKYLPNDWADGYPNVWLGTSVESSKVLHRVEELTSVPAVVHFLSIEPLIGEIAVLPLIDIEWVIVGGESGPGARPMEKDWVLSILKQCKTAKVPFFFKQWGGFQKKKHGRLLNERTYDEMPRPRRATRIRLPLVAK